MILATALLAVPDTLFIALVCCVLPLGMAAALDGVQRLLSSRAAARQPVQSVAVFRVARDGRSFLQTGRVCIFGRRGETEASLRARVSL